MITLSLNSLDGIGNTYSLLGGQNKVFPFLGQHGTTFTVNKENVGQAEFHNGELLTYCIEVCQSFAVKNKLRFFTGLCSLGGNPLALHCWLLDDVGLLYDPVYQTAQYIPYDRLYIGIETSIYTDIFSIVFGDKWLGHIYYSQYLYLWHKNHNNDIDLKRQWWLDGDFDLPNVTEQQILESAFTNLSI